MSKRYRDIPGFPGDAETDVELHHAGPIYWTKKMTIWSVAMLVIFIILAGIVFVTAMQ